MKIGSEFLEDYERLSGDVTGSNARTFVDNLNRWFDLLDGDPGCSPVTKAIESVSSFETWYAQQVSTGGSFAGSAKIVWPKNKETRLGMQLSLFRAFADEEVEV